MILQRLILKNFRQFEGTNRLDFNLIDNKHVTLIFASNGVGKTTILSAIDWCLYGGKEIPYGDRDHRSIFLNKNIFDTLNENDEAKVEVILSFEDRGHSYIVKRSVNVKKINGKQINTINDVHVEVDEELQHNGQKRIESVLSKAMKGYFFFKGEGVGKYADGANPKLVQKGIKNIMKIDFREEARNLIEKVRKKFEKESANLQEKQGAIDVPEARQAEIETEKEKLENVITKAEDDIEVFDELLKANQEKLSKVKSTKDLNQQAENLRNQIQKVKNDINESQLELKSLITKSAYMALSNNVFQTTNNILEQKRKNGELPIIGIGKEFVEKILEQHQCICGETFVEGDSHYNALIKIMNNATAKSGIEASVSSLGTYISANLNKRDEFEVTFKKMINSLTEKEKEKNKLEQKLEAIEEKIQEELPAEDNLMKRRNELRVQRDDSISNKARAKEKITLLDVELKKIQQQIDTATIHDAEITRLRNRIAFCKQAIEMLDTENKIEIDKIRSELTIRLQDKFSKILHANKTAELDEDFKLNIVENGISTPKSDGEDKLISLIFISTLIDMARERENKKDHDNLDPGAGIYPIVIDSPYGEFDSVYKKNISEAVKTLAPQVIILLNQEHWNEGKAIGGIFEDALAHQYALIAHRPKLDILESDRNILRMPNGQSFDLEVQDDREFTSIKEIEVGE